MRVWLGSYDERPVRPHDEPPALPANVTAFVSPLARTQETARLCGIASATTLPELREAPLPAPSGLWRLKPSAWLVLLRLRWAFGPGGSANRAACGRRAERAADALEAAAQTTAVIAVTHGIQGRAIVQALKRRGWTGSGRLEAGFTLAKRKTPPSGEPSGV